MGAGVYVENIKATANFKVTNWSSLTRAELDAIWAAVLIIPSNSTTIIKTDNQAAIDGINSARTIFIKRQWLKLTNRSIIAKIVSTIKTKQLALQFVKIKEHSSSLGNDIADEQANLGHLSIQNLDLDDYNQASLWFTSKWKNRLIERPLRKF